MPKQPSESDHTPQAARPIDKDRPSTRLEGFEGFPTRFPESFTHVARESEED
jgi:hypothetical protein